MFSIIWCVVCSWHARLTLWDFEYVTSLVGLRSWYESLALWVLNQYATVESGVKIHSIGPIAESFSTVLTDHYLLVCCSDDFPLCSFNCAGSHHRCWDDRHSPSCSIFWSSKSLFQGLIGLLSLDLGKSEAARWSNNVQFNLGLAGRSGETARPSSGSL